MSGDAFQAYNRAVGSAYNVAYRLTAASVGDKAVAAKGSNSADVASYEQDQLIVEKAAAIMEGHLGGLFGQLVGVFYAANQMQGPMAMAYRNVIQEQVKQMQKTTQAVIERYSTEMAAYTQETEDSKKRLEVARRMDSQYMASSQGMPDSVQANEKEIAFSFMTKEGDPVINTVDSMA